jgi:hypothetical protein
MFRNNQNISHQDTVDILNQKRMGASLPASVEPIPCPSTSLERFFPEITYRIVRIDVQLRTH